MVMSRSLVCFKQSFHLAYGHAALNQAFNLFDTQDIFVIKLPMPALAPLRFEETVATLPRAQRDGVDCTSFGNFTDTV
ncbi:hypothetical protein D3C75_1112220 [compost metagenome]